MWLFYRMTSRRQNVRTQHAASIQKLMLHGRRCMRWCTITSWNMTGSCPISSRSGSEAGQHEGPNLDSFLCPGRKRGRDLRRLPESCAAHTPPAPADSHGCLVRDTDTTHYHLLPGVFGLQEMAPQIRWSVPLP